MKKQQKILFAIGTIGLLLLFAFGILRFGGVEQLLAYVNGQVIYLSPRLFDLGAHEAESETTATFKLTNLSSKAISIVGESSSCRSCLFSEQVPAIVAPGKTIDLTVNVYLPKYDSSYDQTLTFMVAEQNRLAMYPVRIKATILNPLPQPDEEEWQTTNPQ